jgi:tetratricopeptide (TPR) repeat protein
MRTIFNDHRLILLIIGLFNLANASEATASSWLDSAASRYTVAAKQYNMDSLRNIADYISRKPANEQKTPEALLLLGCVVWRQQLIAYCINSESDIMRYGKESVKKLNEAEKAGTAIYLTASYKALAYQLMAGQGINNGAINGPLAGKELKKAQKANPQGYYALLVEGINTYQAPSFVGGSPQKAIAIFDKMIASFPDSVDVKIHLANACIKAKRMEKAIRLLESVITDYPANLLAQKIAEQLDKK